MSPPVGPECAIHTLKYIIINQHGDIISGSLRSQLNYTLLCYVCWVQSMDCTVYGMDRQSMYDLPVQSMDFEESKARIYTKA